MSHVLCFHPTGRSHFQVFNTCGEHMLLVFVNESAFHLSNIKKKEERVFREMSSARVLVSEAVAASRAATNERYAIALAQWKRDSSFSGMARHLVEDVHGTFRQNFHALKREASKARAAEAVVAEKAAKLFHRFKMCVSQLEHHHQAEDQLFFPQFRQQVPSSGPDFDILENDHKQLHPLETLVMDLKAPINDRLDAIVEFVDFLEDHLRREEMLLVPMLSR